MIRLAFKIPRTVTVAFSGGVDSVAVVDFLSRNHNVTCAFFHHGTENSESACNFVHKFCVLHELPLIVGYLNESKNSKKSLEEHWRDERYAFLDKLGLVVTAHHLDDCMETYIMSALHGKPKVIPFGRNNVVRPFLTTRKKDFIDWCERKNLNWHEDTSNQNNNFMRNYVRNVLMPHALNINPGLHKVVTRLVTNQPREFLFSEKDKLS